MREMSDVWKRLVTAKHTSVEYKFIIDRVEYTKADEVGHTVHKSLFESFGIGNATIAQLDLTIYAENVSAGAKIERKMRLVSGDGQTTSDWEPAGEFFVSRRALDDEKWTIEAYDAMRKAGTVWVPDQSLEFPMTMSDAVDEFCRIMGVELDPRTVLNTEYTIDYPTNDYTIRNCLCFIGAANCGNWIITPEGKLYLVPLITTGTPHAVGLNIMSFADNGARKAVTRVTLKVDSEQVLTAGGDYGVEVVADCPYATQAMVDALLAKLEGFVYHPYEAGAAMLDPAAELGDPVEVDDITSIIVSMDDDGEGFPDIMAPGEQELDDEYPEAGPMYQQINRKIAENKSYIKKTADEVTLAVEGVNGELSKIETKIGSITLSVSDPTADGYVSLSLIVGGVTQSLGLIKMDGNVDISGSLSAAELYAELGDIAQLTVDSLSTARKIPRYLARDTSDINYVDIRDRRIALVRAWTDGTTVQATNPNGQALYWETDITDAEIGDDGYPYLNKTRVFAKTNVTDYPVMIYRYSEGDRWLQTFEANNNYGPIQYWGEGYGDQVDLDRGKGILRKLGASFDMLLKTSSGAYSGIYCRDDGFADVTQRRASISVDTINNVIVVRPEGALAESYSIEMAEDANGNLDLTWPDGQTFRVEVL